MRTLLCCGLLLLGGALESRAGFIGNSCTNFGCSLASPDTASLSPASTLFNPDGDVTYSWNSTFGGGLVNGQPNLLTSASLDVSDSASNPVPTLGTEFQLIVGENYTDTVAVTNPGPQITFNFSLAVDNTANSNFDEIASSLAFLATGLNASNNQIFSFEWFSPNVTGNGSTATDYSFSTPALFDTSATASMNVQLTLTSQVWYSNFEGAITASDTGVGASDASHTLIFQSIQSGNGTFSSANGANYNGPEPASWVTVAAGMAALLIGRRRA